MSWISVKDLPPSNGVVVETKISDNFSEKNFAELKRVNNLWFLPDGSMYVYYTPTHWRSVRCNFKR